MTEPIRTMEVKTDDVYRLTWEHPNPYTGEWGEHSRTDTVAGGILDQARTLKKWEDTGEQQIRKVRLEIQVSRPVFESVEIVG